MTQYGPGRAARTSEPPKALWWTRATRRRAISWRCGDAGNKRLKLRVTQGKYKLTYDLNTSGNYEVFPLQLGDGSYTVELFENVSGKKYSAEGKVSVNVKLDDPYAPFLGPNQYVNYTPDTEAVQTSYELWRGHDRSAGDF